MKKGLLVAVFFIVSLAGVSLYASGGQEAEGSFKKANIIPGVPSVEIIYLNHSPVRKVISDIDSLLEGYGEKIQTVHYIFSSPEGKSFAKSKKLEGHIPLEIFIDGSNKFHVDNRTFEFISFPQGGGTGFVADGQWSIEDLKKVIDGILEKK